jgi:hypothetical protein
MRLSTFKDQQQSIAYEQVLQIAKEACNKLQLVEDTVITTEDVYSILQNLLLEIEYLDYTVSETISGAS